MGQQHRKETKRRRRAAYIRRQKEKSGNSKTASSVQLAAKIVKVGASSAGKKAPAGKLTSPVSEA